MMISPEMRAYIERHSHDDIRQLLLKGGDYPFDLKEAVRLIEARQKLRTKLPLWVQQPEMIYPSLLSTEQCSSQWTAQYKATLLPEGVIGADLTGGLGVDSYFFSRRARKWFYIERFADYCDAARHNFSRLEGSSSIEVRNEEALHFLQQTEQLSFIYLDPARRGEENRRLFQLEDYEPNFLTLIPELKRLRASFMIKVSPMADLTQLLSQVPHVHRVDIVSLHNECKEILLSGTFAQADESTHLLENDPEVHCINILSDDRIDRFTFRRSEEQTVVIPYAEKPEGYLYEPNTSILKAGAFKQIAAQWNVQKLHPISHLYTSAQLLPDFPGRCFRIVELLPFSSSILKKTLSKIERANITVRNFPLTVAELRKKTKIKEGGDLYLFATTLSDSQRVIVVCEKG